MKLLINLAWRNIWRNKRRSLITILAVAFAVTLSVAMRGIQLGTYAVNIKTAVELFSGYLQVQARGYQKNPSLQKSFVADSTIIGVLQHDPAVVAFTPRIIADGLISFRQNSTGSAIFAVDPAGERRASQMPNRVNSGRLFNPDSLDEIVVGYKLLSNLNARLGDRVVILAQGFDGSLGNLKFKIVGTVRTGVHELDAAAVFMNLHAADELLAMHGRINSLVIALSDVQEVAATRQRLQEKLSRHQLSVLSWEEILPELKQAIQLDNVSGILFLAILVLVVGFGIMNTVLMSVTERFREFGVTLSIGMPPIQLVKLVMLETAFITLIGIVVGNVLGWLVNYYIVLNPILFSGDFAELYLEYGFLPRLESTIRAGIFVNSTLLTLAVSAVACLYPAIKVYRLEPLKGIRYT